MSVVRRQYGRGHGYQIDKKKAIGVTTALGIIDKHLDYWAAGAVAQHVADMDVTTLLALRSLRRDEVVAALRAVPFEQRTEAARRGTAVHKLAESLILGEPVEYADEYAGHVQSLVRFMDEWKPRPVLMERVVGSYKWGYAGTFDLVADLPDGRRMLFDYKTGNRVYGEVGMQLAAYRYAEVYVGDDGTEIPMSEVGIGSCAVVHVRADGYDVIPVEAGETQFACFLHALGLARRCDEIATWVGEAIRP